MHPHAAAEFYAPWCGVCAGFKPGYWMAARQLAGEGLGGTLAMIDASSKDDPAVLALKEEWGVTGYPKMLHFLDGVPVHWTQKSMAAADAPDIVGYIARFQGGKRPWRRLASASGLADWVKEKADVAVVAVFDVGDGDANGGEVSVALPAVRHFLKDCRRIQMQARHGGGGLACAFAAAKDVPDLKFNALPAAAFFKKGALSMKDSQAYTEQLWPAPETTPLQKKQEQEQRFDHLAAHHPRAAAALREQQQLQQRTENAAAQAAQLASSMSDDELDEL